MVMSGLPLKPNGFNRKMFARMALLPVPLIDHFRLSGLALGEGASRPLERGAGQRCLPICLHRTDAQQASMGLFTDVENVAMAVSHMHNGLGGLALCYEFVGHFMVIRDLMGPSSSKPPLTSKSGRTVEQGNDRITWHQPLPYIPGGERRDWLSASTSSNCHTTAVNSWLTMGVSGSPSRTLEARRRGFY